MDQKTFLKQIVDFNKTTFDNTFNSLALLQEQVERMSKTVLEQATWLPEEAKKAINDWAQACKKGQDEYKKIVEDNFKKVEAFLDS